MFIIDFDDTLFDTQRLKTARLHAMSALGVSEEDFWKSYRDATVSPDGYFTYTNERHAQMLMNYGYDFEAVYEAFRKTTEDLRTYLFTDTIAFLTAIRNTKQPMVLLSLGDPKFQELKVKSSGIHKLFDRMFMVNDSKESVLHHLFETVDPGNVWFINDKVHETERLLQTFPRMRCIMKIAAHIDRKKYSECGLPYFDSLTEINTYVTRDHK